MSEHFVPEPVGEEQVVEQLETMEVHDDVDALLAELSSQQGSYSDLGGNVVVSSEPEPRTVRIVRNEPVKIQQQQQPVIAIRGNQVYKVAGGPQRTTVAAPKPTGRLQKAVQFPVVSNSGSPVKLQLVPGQPKKFVTVSAPQDRKPVLVQQTSPIKTARTAGDKVQLVRVVGGQAPKLVKGTSSYVINSGPSGTGGHSQALRTLAPAMTASGELITVGSLAKKGELITSTQRPQKKPQPFGHRKPCNCTKSGCLKLYCDCFANGEFCRDCNCKECHNNLDSEAERSKAIKSCLERNPHAFQPKIGKGRSDIERLHQKGCHCKKSNCLKNYCECYEAKVPCTRRCKCCGCRNTENDRFSKHRDFKPSTGLLNLAAAAADIRTQSPMSEQENDRDMSTNNNEPLNPKTMPWFYMTDEVVEATTLCLVAQAEEMESQGMADEQKMEKAILKEFGKCLEQIIANATNATAY